MSSNKYLWSQGVYMLQCLGLVVAWVASYVCHQHLYALNLKECKVVVYTACDAAIDVAIYGPQGLEPTNLVGELQGAYVACVPYLVAGGKECSELLVKGVVCI